MDPEDITSRFQKDESCMISPMRCESNPEIDNRMVVARGMWQEGAEVAVSSGQWVIQLGTMTSLKDPWWPRKAVHLKYTIINRAPAGMQLSGAVLAQHAPVLG